MIFHKDTWGGLRHPGEQRTERAGPKGQTFHGYGEQNAPAGRLTNLHPNTLLRAQPLRFCDFPGKALKAPQEIQEMQEIQERPCGATDGVPEKTARRETEGGGRGQRRSRRATDGARSVSRLTLRLCGSMEGVA